KLVHDVEVPVPVGPMQAIAGRDDATGEVVIKVINRADKPTPMTVDIKGIAAVDSDVKVTQLSSERITDNNTLDNPNRVIPVESRVHVAGPRFEYTFPALSLTVLRVTPRK